MVPEPVDVDFFNPKGVTPLELPLGKLVFGRARSEADTVAFLSVSLFQVFKCACCARQARNRKSMGKKSRIWFCKPWLQSHRQHTCNGVYYNCHSVPFCYVGINLTSAFHMSRSETLHHAGRI